LTAAAPALAVRDLIGQSSQRVAQPASLTTTLELYPPAASM
jgi:hypothetical protein